MPQVSSHSTVQQLIAILADIRLRLGNKGCRRTVAATNGTWYAFFSRQIAHHLFTHPWKSCDVLARIAGYCVRCVPTIFPVPVPPEERSCERVVELLLDRLGPCPMCKPMEVTCILGHDSLQIGGKPCRLSLSPDNLRIGTPAETGPCGVESLGTNATDSVNH